MKKTLILILIPIVFLMSGCSDLVANNHTYQSNTFRGCFEKCKNNYNLANSVCGIANAFELMHNSSLNASEIYNGCIDKAQQDEERCFTNCQIEYQTGN